MSTPGPGPEAILTRAEFGAALTRARIAAGKTVRDVAREVGLSASTVGGYFSGKHVLPLRSASQLPQILAACGVTDTAELAAWSAALQRVRLAPGPRPAGQMPPYRGLASFEPGDAERFFGRDQITEQILNLIAQRERDGGALVVVTGASGSGKSSVLGAGVTAQLAGRAHRITPGADPVSALRSAGALGPDDVVIADQFEELFTNGAEPADQVRFIETLAAGPAVAVIGLRADFFRAAIEFPPLARAIEESSIVVGPMTEEQLRAVIQEPGRAAGVDIEPGLVDLIMRDLGPSGTDALPLLSHALLSTWEHGRHRQMTAAGYLAAGGLRGSVAETAEEVFVGLNDERQRTARNLFRRLVTVSDDGVGTRRRVTFSEVADLAHAGEVIDVFAGRRLLVADQDGVQLIHEALLEAWPRLRTWLDHDREGLLVHRRLTASASEWARTSRDPSALYRGGRLDATRFWAEQGSGAAELNAVERDFLRASIAAQEDDAAQAVRRNRRLRALVAGLMVLVLVTTGLSVFALRLRGEAAHDRDLATSREIAAAASRIRATDPGLAAQLALAAYRLQPTREATSALLDSSAQALPERLTAPDGVAQALATSADNRLLAASGGAGVVRLWQRDASGRRYQRASDVSVSPGSTVFALALDARGHTLAVGGADRRVHLYDVSDPARARLETTLSGPGDTVFGLAISADGNQVAAASADAALYRWDLNTGPDGAAARPLPPLRPQAGAIHAVAFAPAGPGGHSLTVAAGTDEGVRLWSTSDAGDGGDLRPVPLAHARFGIAVLSVAFSSDGSSLAAGCRCQPGILRGWDRDGVSWQAPKPWPSDLSGPGSWINGISFEPGAGASTRRLAAASSDNQVWIWDGARPASHLIQPGPVTAVLALNGGTRIATADVDGQIRIWATRSRQTAPDAGTPYQLTYTRSGDRLFSGSTSGQPRWWSTRDSAAPQPVSEIAGVNGAVLTGAATTTGDGALVAAGARDGRVFIWGQGAGGQPGDLRATIQAGTHNVEWLTFSPDGATLAAGGDDSAVTLWDVRQPSAPAQLGSALPADNYVFAIAFSPDGQRIAVGTAAGTVQLWDITVPARARRAGPALRAATQYVYSVSFSRTGDLLAAATSAKTTTVWSLPSTGAPQRLQTVTGPANSANFVAFSPDGGHMAVGSEDGDVWIYQLAGRAGHEHADPAATLHAAGARVISLAYSPDGRSLAAGATGAITFWTTDAEAAGAAICAGRGDPMTRAEWSALLPDTPFTQPCSDS